MVGAPGTVRDPVDGAARPAFSGVTTGEATVVAPANDAGAPEVPVDTHRQVGSPAASNANDVPLDGRVFMAETLAVAEGATDAPLGPAVGRVALARVAVALDTPAVGDVEGVATPVPTGRPPSWTVVLGHPEAVLEGPAPAGGETSDRRTLRRGLGGVHAHKGRVAPVARVATPVPSPVARVLVAIHHAALDGTPIRVAPPAVAGLLGPPRHGAPRHPHSFCFRRTEKLAMSYIISTFSLTNVKYFEWFIVVLRGRHHAYGSPEGRTIPNHEWPELDQQFGERLHYRLMWATLPVTFSLIFQVF